MKLGGTSGIFAKNQERPRLCHSAPREPPHKVVWPEGGGYESITEVPGVYASFVRGDVPVT
jgi:hypothetical protein